MKTATEEDDQEDELERVTTLTEQEWIISEDEDQSHATPEVLQLGATAGQGREHHSWQGEDLRLLRPLLESGVQRRRLGGAD